MTCEMSIDICAKRFVAQNICTGLTSIKILSLLQYYYSISVLLLEKTQQKQQQRKTKCYTDYSYT